MKLWECSPTYLFSTLGSFWLRAILTERKWEEDVTRMWATRRSLSPCRAECSFVAINDLDCAQDQPAFYSIWIWKAKLNVTFQQKSILLHPFLKKQLDVSIASERVDISASLLVLVLVSLFRTYNGLSRSNLSHLFTTLPSLPSTN